MTEQVFTPIATAALTSTTSSQTIIIPPGSTTLIVYNGGSNSVYFRFGASVTVPSGIMASGVYLATPGQTILYASPQSGGSLAYIADTAGGPLSISVGVGN